LLVRVFHLHLHFIQADLFIVRPNGTNKRQ